ncbi:MAG: Lrp/AsnC ligand binding domain-containing protein [Nitrosopumilus sp.]|nr:Lrp/AsnC ligand binding domain-containing protein [Nitrosopumilus sp.]
MGNSSVAFVLIMCKFESISEILQQMNEVDVVAETAIVVGPWKIIVKLEATDLDHIREAIRWKLRKMTGIESTLTLVEYMS